MITESGKVKFDSMYCLLTGGQRGKVSKAGRYSKGR